MRNTIRKTIAIFLASFLTISLFATAAFADSQSIDSTKFRTAVIQELELQAGGSASILRDGTTMKAEKGVRLVPGDMITTVGQAKLYILIDQDKVLRLDYDSQVVLKETFFGTKIKIQLIAGRLFYNVMRQLPENENLDFASGNVTITVRGTSGLIGTREDKFEHMLFDGHTQVNAGTKTIMQIPGQEISFRQVAGQEYEDSLDIRHFILDELPESLIEEIRKDPELKARVLASVPKTYAADGTPEFVDPATFDITQLKGVKDDSIMPMTTSTVTGTKSSGGGSSSGGASTPPTPAPEPPKPAHCTVCDADYDANNPEEVAKHTLTTCENKECAEEKHEYYPCDIAEAEKHEIHNCSKCGDYYACSHITHRVVKCKDINSWGCDTEYCITNAQEAPKHYCKYCTEGHPYCASLGEECPECKKSGPLGRTKAPSVRFNTSYSEKSEQTQVEGFNEVEFATSEAELENSEVETEASETDPETPEDNEQTTPEEGETPE